MAEEAEVEKSNRCRNSWKKKIKWRNWRESRWKKKDKWREWTEKVGKRILRAG